MVNIINIIKTILLLLLMYFVFLGIFNNKITPLEITLSTPVFFSQMTDNELYTYFSGWKVEIGYVFVK